jgi:hypothetical protein
LSVAQPRSRLLQFGLFVAAIAWYFCARAVAGSAADGLAGRFDLAGFRPPTEAAIVLFLTVLGLALLRAIERRRGPLRIALGLPRRATAAREWATGAAIGWGIAIASILPLAVGRTLDVRLWTSPRAFQQLGLALATLALATLAHSLAVYGYGFHRLIDAIGPVRATLLLAGFAAMRTALNPAAAGPTTATMLLVGLLASLLLSIGWLRTYGLWLLWGLHFAWAASIGALFGLPVGGMTDYSSVVETRCFGPIWLTGGGFGPAGTVFFVLVLLAAIPVLVKATDDFAWDYTRPPIVAAGYDVTIAPPAAHAAMEQEAQARPAPLVQILPSTPRGGSGPPDS